MCMYTIYKQYKPNTVKWNQSESVANLFDFTEKLDTKYIHVRSVHAKNFL